jgi:integrase
MRRDAEPLDIRPLSAFHDACIEEIHEGNENWGLCCLLGLHTGLRRRVLGHYTDDWRADATGGQKIELPSGKTPCTIEESGCNSCHKPRLSYEEGYFGVKKNTAGEGRTVPIWEKWMDYHRDESRPTQLPEMLDAYFSTNNVWGLSPGTISKIVKQVAARRHDVIAQHHEGEGEFWMSNEKRTVPDIMPHDLRATWATQCLRAGVEDNQLMDWAGWKTPEMIQKYRSKLDDPSGENRSRYAGGRESEGLSATEKLDKLRQLGVIDDDENLSADELAEVVNLLD